MLLLRQSLSLCQSLLQREERLEAAYFEAVRTLLTRVEGKGKISFREFNERVNELLKQSIKPEAVQDFYTNEQLIAITRELTDALRTNKTIDWTMKESARAGMRRIVKRLLKKYKYPPEGQEAALETIMTQCEMWSQNEFE